MLFVIGCMKFYRERNILSQAKVTFRRMK